MINMTGAVLLTVAAEPLKVTITKLIHEYEEDSDI